MNSSPRLFHLRSVRPLRALVATCLGTIGVLTMIQGAGAIQNPHASTKAASPKINLSNVTLNIGQNESTTQMEQTLQASGALKGAPYKISWSTFSGPAAMMTALQSGAIDAGVNFGDVSVTLANAAATSEWTKSTAPVKLIAEENYVTPDYLTMASVASGITKLSQIKGQKIIYDTGGNIQAMFLLDLKKAGLQESDVQQVIVPASSVTSTFLAGGAPIVIGSTSTLDQLGSAVRVIATEKEVDLPGLNGIAASTAALDNRAKDAALKDLVSRITRLDAWYPKHLSEVATIDEDVLNTPASDALATAKDAETYLEPATPTLLKSEQALATALVQGGVINTHLVNVNVEYDLSFNSVIDAGDQKYGLPKGVKL